ncbi:uncharacterized protein LOC110841928 isoform X2 [Folsomia candida]|uniref:uncharacterized protein LOC110841928 isoform X2 n=1 Tax=Folsomia candida TaxID=158441 RepID=UPI000B8F4F16|nr:uncharacterized protein LOC110841928 isoform X2 [Folsomia candida]
MKFAIFKCILVLAVFVEMNKGNVLSNNNTQSAILRQERQRNILDQLLNSIQGILGQPKESPIKTTTELIVLGEEEKTATHASAQISVPIPARSKPGTTNNGGFVNQVVATASGISSGLFGSLGINIGPHSVPFLNYQTSPRPSGSGKRPVPPTVRLEGLITVPILDIVKGVFAQASACNDIRKLLGQCQ